MAEIYEFKNNSNELEEESCDCKYCQLAHEFTSIISDAESVDEVFHILRDLVSEASGLTIIEFLESEIQNNTELVHKLKYGFDEE